jgi:Chemotaxis phosphatase CheX
MSTALSMSRWLAVLTDATTELAQVTFNTAPSPAEPIVLVPPDREGSLLPLYVGEETLQVGVLATPEACRDLTKALLGLEPPEEPGESDIPDAVGEIVNIIAGILQRKVNVEEGQAVALGFPVHFLGTLVSTSNVETVAARVNLGPALAELVVVRTRPIDPDHPRKPLFARRKSA